MDDEAIAEASTVGAAVDHVGVPVEEWHVSPELSRATRRVQCQERGRPCQTKRSCRTRAAALRALTEGQRDAEVAARKIAATILLQGEQRERKEEQHQELCRERAGEESLRTDGEDARAAAEEQLELECQIAVKPG